MSQVRAHPSRMQVVLVPEHIARFLAVVEGRPDAEVAQILGVVEAAARGMDAAAAAELRRLVEACEGRVRALTGASS